MKHKSIASICRALLKGKSSYQEVSNPSISMETIQSYGKDHYFKLGNTMVNIPVAKFPQHISEINKDKNMICNYLCDVDMSTQPKVAITHVINYFLLNSFPFNLPSKCDGSQMNYIPFLLSIHISAWNTFRMEIRNFLKNVMSFYRLVNIFLMPS